METAPIRQRRGTGCLLLCCECAAHHWEESNRFGIRSTPPDIVVEIDITNESSGKFPIYAALGVPEIWIYDTREAKIYELTASGYVETGTSHFYPDLTGAMLAEALESSKSHGQTKVPSKSLPQTDESESQRIGTSASAEGGGNGLGSGHAKQRDRDVAQRSHDLSSGATADAGAVFVEGDIADPVKTVFDRPMTAAQTQQGWRTGGPGFDAGNAINGFGAECCRGEVGGIALNGKNLGSIRKVQIAVQFTTGPDVADFQTAMTFLSCGVLRGGKTPVSNRRCLGGGWADCLSR